MRADIEYEPVSVAQASALDSAVGATARLGVRFAAEAGEGNVLVSPASITVALALLAEGSDGRTETALDEVLGAAGPERTAAFSALQDTVLAHDGDPSIVEDEELPERPLLHLANGVTVDEARTLEPEYLDALARAYDAGVLTADFAGGRGKPALDAWVDEHTGGLIEESAIEPDPETAFVLQNAVLMAARWESPFTEAASRESPFTTASGEERSPDTMHQTLAAGYAEHGGMQAIRLPYAEAFAMDVVLPAEGTAPGDLSTDEWGRISETLDAAEGTQVALALPKLDFEYSTPLDEAFRDMGLDPIFEPGGLDGITQGAYVQQAAHQAVLRVDEEGTVAAAVTEIAGALSAAPIPQPVEMTVDRPFALRIVDVETGWPLFHAVVNDPEG